MTAVSGGELASSPGPARVGLRELLICSSSFLAGLAGDSAAQSPELAAQLRSSLERGVNSSLLTLRTARAAGVELEIARALFYVADAHASLGRVPQASAYYDSSLVMARASGDRLLEAGVLQGVARLYHRMAESADLARALPLYAQAATVRAALRTSAGADRFRVGAAEQGADLYGDFGAAVLGLPGLDPEAARLGALAAAEAGRAQALLDLRSGSSTPDETPLIARIGRASSAAEVATALEGSARRLLEDLGPVSFLYYQLAADTVLIWTRTAGSEVRLFRQPLTAEYSVAFARRVDMPPHYLATLLPGYARDSIAARVTRVRSALGTVNAFERTGVDMERSEVVGGETAADLETAVTELTDLILPLRVLEALPDSGELIIVPFGPTALVPFALLPVDRDEDGKQLLLGERYALRYAPSLATLAELARFRGERERTLPAPVSSEEADEWHANWPNALVVGNPVMPEIRIGVRRVSLEPLPGAESEAQDIAHHLGVAPLLGSEATETEVWDRIADAPVVHLATHGLAYASERRTRESFVALASTGGPRPDARADGRLTVGEVLDSGPGLSAELVVLSACQTALGSVTETEGTLGFQRAFLARGARSVLVSLWNVSDQATRQLMSRFYYHWLARGQSKPEALRLAQRDVRTTPGWEDPRFWAAFQLVGG